MDDTHTQSVRACVRSRSTTMSSSVTTTTETQTKTNTLLGFHAGYFRISLSLASQALLWKTFVDLSPNSHGHVLSRLAAMLPSTAFALLWSSALLSLLLLSSLYSLRCLLRSRSVLAEFRHHVGVNYLFAPWISALFLLQSSPFVDVRSRAYLVLWCAFILPVVALDVKVYGQWFTREKKGFLSMVANPTSQMSVMANMAGARAAAAMGWRESALFMFSMGISHYLVLIVTLYQRFVGSDRLPVMMRPVFFLFFAAPSMATLAWDSIAGSFDVGAKMLFFLSLFLFASLVVRPAMFKKSMRRSSVTWWAYSFPLTMLAVASTRYAQVVKNDAANVLMLVLAVLSVVVFLALVLLTVIGKSGILPGHDPFDTGAQDPTGIIAITCNCNGGGPDVTKIVPCDTGV